MSLYLFFLSGVCIYAQNPIPCGGFDYDANTLRFIERNGRPTLEVIGGVQVGEGDIDLTRYLRKDGDVMEGNLDVGPVVSQTMNPIPFVNLLDLQNFRSGDPFSEPFTSNELYNYSTARVINIAIEITDENGVG